MAQKKSKKCPQCSKKGLQPLSAFNKNVSARDGHQSICRECQKKQGRAKTKAKGKARRATPTRRAAKRAAKAGTAARKRSGPGFVISKAAVPEALRREIEAMAWEVLVKQLKRFSAQDRRVLRMYAQAQGVEV